MIVQPFGFNLKKAATAQDPVFQGLGTLYTSIGDEQVSTAQTTITSVSANDLILVFVQRNNQAQCTGVASTTPSITFTLLESAESGDTGFNCDIWGAKAPSSAASVDITASYSAAGAYSSIFSARWNNCPASITPSHTAATTAKQTSSTSRTVSNITTSARCLLIAAGCDWNNFCTHTAASGWTKRADYTVLGANTTQYMLDRVANSGTYPSGNFSTTSVADEYTAAIIAIPL